MFSRFYLQNMTGRALSVCLSVCLWSNDNKTGINDYVKRLFVYAVTVIEISSEDEQVTPGISKRQGSVDIENGKFIHSFVCFRVFSQFTCKHDRK